jgi:hypothetical protein
MHITSHTPLLNSERARIDFSIRSKILLGHSVIKIPKGAGSRIFWSAYTDGVKAKTKLVQDLPRVDAYIFDKPAIRMKSSGLESTVIEAMWGNIPSVDYKSNPLGFEWTDPIEGALAILGAGLGYGVTIYGDELNEKETLKSPVKPFYFETTQEFAHLWNAYAGVHFISPFSAFRKSEVLEVAIRENLEFYSCANSNTSWCGRCYKCYQVAELYTRKGHTPPFDVKEKSKDWPENFIADYEDLMDC